MVWSCLSSRSVHLELAEGYDTGIFIKVLIRFSSFKGFPRNIYSDNATQLVSANKEIRQMIDKWDLDRIVNFGRFQRISWV